MSRLLRSLQPHVPFAHTYSLLSFITGLFGCLQRTYETVDWSKFESPLDDLDDEEEEEEEEEEDEE